MISSIDYQTLPPPALPGKAKIIQFAPLGNYSNALGAGDVVRFDLSNVEGLLDPMSTYFEITVNFNSNPRLLDDATYTQKIIQLDSSANSLWTQLLVQNGSEELERIQEYDTIACIINDLGFNNNDRFCKDYEGLGGYFTGSLINQGITSVRTAYSNSGNVNATQNWSPDTNPHYYVDSNAGGAAFGTTATIGTGTSYTNNHPYVNNQLAPNPYYNFANITYSAGTDTREYYNDYNTATPGSSATARGTPSLFNPAFAQGTMEPFFSPTVYQRYMKNGFVKTDFLTSATFFLPVYSGIIGQLQPMNNHTLLPLWLMKLNIEMTFNQYAFFTSWFTKDQSARAYTVTNLLLHATLIEPTDEVRAYINNQALNGIRIPTNSFDLGTRQAIYNGGVPPTTMIPQKYKKLKNLWTVFLPMDYTVSANCRKQYRLSMAIKRMQLRVGTDYYPTQPIRGNGGNNFGPINNYEFVRMLYKSVNKLMAPSGCINPHNFAVNFRAINPNDATVNNYTNNVQFGFLSENQVVGKAVYALALEKGNNLNGSIESGINTAVSNVQLELDYDNSVVFNRNVTMFVFCHFEGDLLIKSRELGDDNSDVKYQI